MKSVAHHCRELITAYTSLVLNRDFVPMPWSWLDIYQPLNALMILINEVDPEVQAPKATLSREVVEEFLGLCGHQGGVVSNEGERVNPGPLTDACVEAWDSVYRLRAQVWRRAGLDPNVFWPREDVIARVRRRIERTTEVASCSTAASRDLGDDLMPTWLTDGDSNWGVYLASHGGLG